MFEEIISLENLLAAWREFKRGKTRKPDVQEFYLTLEERLFEVHASLRDKTYTPEPYVSFFVSDPKLRHIHKATVRDRVVHQAIFRALYPLFDNTFIHDSYSCRRYKGTHRGVRQLARYLNKVSANHTRPAYALKCDIQKFFDSIDHDILYKLLARRVQDPDMLWLLRLIIDSFKTWTSQSQVLAKGLPLGNVTSQLFANIYLNELDQYAKHILKAKYYLRYCDDFIILSRNKTELEKRLRYIVVFLRDKLKLEMHPRKVEILKAGQGIDFLGYVLLPHATMLRTCSKRRMFRRLGAAPKEAVRQSYLGMLSHANARKLRERVKSL